MRTIKFRGKSILTDEWLYGDLVHSADNKRFGILVNDKDSYDEYEVAPETVGQFTGLYDCDCISGDFKLHDHSEYKWVSKDELLKQAIEFGYGIRLLNQDPFEMVISFIISARNSIPSIMKTIKKISEKFGDKIEYKGEIYYAFPTPEQLKNETLEDIQETGASFRSKYIIDTIYNINMALEAKKSGNLTDELKMYDLDYIMSLPTDECHVALQAFKGVGAKVADCIMLFSMGKKSAFPVDVWIKRAMIHFYVAPDVSLNKIRVFGREKFGELSGLAQQYLFYYARENNINV